MLHYTYPSLIFDPTVSGHLEGNTLELVEPGEILADLHLPTETHLTRGKMCLYGFGIEEVYVPAYGFEGAYCGLNCARAVALSAHPEAVVYDL